MGIYDTRYDWYNLDQIVDNPLHQWLASEAARKNLLGEERIRSGLGFATDMKHRIFIVHDLY